jgi:hypothetical protein
LASSSRGGDNLHISGRANPKNSHPAAEDLP